MELEKKPKLDQISCCFACLQEVNIDKTKDFCDEIINVYKNLLEEQVNKSLIIILALFSLTSSKNIFYFF